MRLPTAILVLAALMPVTPIEIEDFSEQPRGETPPSEFTFVRLIYSGGGRRGASWAVDYPKADIQFVYALNKFDDLTFINASQIALPITDPELFQYPFAYAVEVGGMRLSEPEVTALREYLMRGGLLVVDDFHGPWEWNRFYTEIKKVLPEYEPFDLPIDHPIFHCYYNIERLFQVPGIQFLYTGRMWEKGGFEPRYMGIADADGRLMVVINHNVDLGDAWEWAEREEYPREFASLAFQLGINYIIYAMTH